MDERILCNIQICADAVNTNVIEHTAYIRASAAQNNIPLDVYHEQVHKELLGPDKGKPSDSG